MYILIYIYIYIHTYVYTYILYNYIVYIYIYIYTYRERERCMYMYIYIYIHKLREPQRMISQRVMRGSGSVPLCCCMYSVGSYLLPVFYGSFDSSGLSLSGERIL